MASNTVRDKARAKPFPKNINVDPVKDGVQRQTEDTSPITPASGKDSKMKKSSDPNPQVK